MLSVNNNVGNNYHSCGNTTHPCQSILFAINDTLSQQNSTEIFIFVEAGIYLNDCSNFSTNLRAGISLFIIGSNLPIIDCRGSGNFLRLTTVNLSVTGMVINNGRHLRNGGAISVTYNTSLSINPIHVFLKIVQQTVPVVLCHFLRVTLMILGSLKVQQHHI